MCNKMFSFLKTLQKTGYVLLVMWLLLSPVGSAQAQVSVAIGLPNLSIGINMPIYPELVPVLGYPVYYAPRVDANYFFYDGMYWVYEGDNWYASSWYNGPWGFVQPEAVPLFVLRIPVKYYRQPPPYFRGWAANAAPRWGQHWGREWEQRRSGWSRWNRSAVPGRAPLPAYQRQYAGERYPRVEQQHSLRSQQYRYQPRDTAVRHQFQQQGGQSASVPEQRGRREEPAARGPERQEQPHANPQHQGGQPDVRPQGRGGQEQGHGRGQNQDDDRGRGRN